jgi:hypothetical protein
MEIFQANQIANQSKESRNIHWPSVLQFGFSLLGAISLWGLALSFILIGFVERFDQTVPVASSLSLFLMAAGDALSGFLLLPSAGYALARIMGHPSSGHPRFLGYIRPTLLILALPVVLLLGYGISRINSLSWLLLPGLHILAIGLPVLWLAYLGVRNLPLGSPQRLWGVFGSGLVLGPAMIMAAEIAALIVVVLVAILFIASRPDLTNELNGLAQRLSQSGSSPETALHILSPYLGKPSVIFTVFIFGSVIVPIIEETLKPIGVWLLANRSLSPAEGFAAGVLSGAGYALFESLALASNGADWTSLVFARIGTGAIHILTTGLTGWALALAWKENRYIRLGLVYLAAVLIHGAWNGFTLSTITSEISQTQGGETLFSSLGAAAPYVLVVLALGCFAILLWANRKLARQEIQEDQTNPGIGVV